MMSILKHLRSLRAKAFARAGGNRQTGVGISPQGEFRRNAGVSVATLTVEEVEQYYDEWTARYIGGFGEVFQGSRPQSTEELLGYLLEAAALEDGMTVLDAGCGVCGPALWFAAHRNIRIEALTISSVQVEKARQRVREEEREAQINVRKGDFHLLSEIYPGASFDRVLFLETLCHAKDYRRVLEEARKVLKPHGLVYIKDFYCVDHRSRPHLLVSQAEDLKSLNEIYHLKMPDIPTTVSLLCELGYDILYLREPRYIYSSAIWEQFMRHSGVYWAPKLKPDMVIRSMEILCQSNP
jgi:ubiquinone/menaquinone biosynthesis C-methylase UbiE